MPASAAGEPRPGERSASQIEPPDAFSPSVCFRTSQHWYGCGEPPAASRGFKLYISFTPLNVSPVLRATVPLLVRHAVHFKYLRDLWDLRKLNSGAFGYAQIGKCLVCYLPDRDDKLLVKLLAALEPFAGDSPVVPFARSLGRGLPLYYRHGRYHDREVLGAGEVEPEDDDRLDYEGAIPADVDDWLRNHAGPDSVSASLEGLLERYPVFEALRQQGKSGIFRALNLASETYEEVILKVAYARGQVQPDGSDGVAFVRREIAFYRELASRGLESCGPGLVDHFEEGDKAALVLRQMSGPDLLTQRLEGKLTVDLAKQAWGLMAALHAAGLYLGDAKIANFLQDGDQRLTVVDFETAGVVGVDPPLRMATFDLQNPRLRDPVQGDRAHFLASVLFPYEAGRYSRGDRVVDLADYAARSFHAPVEIWARSMLRELRANLVADR